MSDEIEITSQELQKILFTANECLTSGKVNKTTADRITDSARVVITAMRSLQESELGRKSAKSRWPSVSCVKRRKSSPAFEAVRQNARPRGGSLDHAAVNQPRIIPSAPPGRGSCFPQRRVRDRHSGSKSLVEGAD